MTAQHPYAAVRLFLTRSIMIKGEKEKVWKRQEVKTLTGKKRGYLANEFHGLNRKRRVASASRRIMCLRGNQSGCVRFVCRVGNFSSFSISFAAGQ